MKPKPSQLSGVCSLLLCLICKSLQLHVRLCSFLSLSIVFSPVDSFFSFLFLAGINFLSLLFVLLYLFIPTNPLSHVCVACSRPWGLRFTIVWEKGVKFLSVGFTLWCLGVYLSLFLQLLLSFGQSEVVDGILGEHEGSQCTWKGTLGQKCFFFFFFLKSISQNQMRRHEYI